MVIGGFIFCTQWISSYTILTRCTSGSVDSCIWFSVDFILYNTNPMHFRVSGFIFYDYHRTILLRSYNTTRCTSGLVGSSLYCYQRTYLLYSVNSSSKIHFPWISSGFILNGLFFKINGFIFKCGLIFKWIHFQ